MDQSDIDHRARKVFQQVIMSRSPYSIRTKYYNARLRYLTKSMEVLESEVVVRMDVGRDGLNVIILKEANKRGPGVCVFFRSRTELGMRMRLALKNRNVIEKELCWIEIQKKLAPKMRKLIKASEEITF